MSNSIRRLSKSVQDSLRRLGSIDSSKRANQTNSSWVYKTDQWVLKYDDGEEVNLTYVKHERVPMKDFAYEVRATLDVGHFLNHAVLLLDIGESSMEEVVDEMITKLFQNTKEHFCTAAEVKACLFANDSVHLLSRTIQGTSMSERASTFDYDQTWICAMCNLPTLQKRHVAIARLKQPVNFGSTCHEVRFFILILCPSKEKGTKNAWEMGRTYSTIFSDMEFRQKLLEATTEEDFKKLIIQQAADLSLRQNEAKVLLAEESEQEKNDDIIHENFCRFGTGVKNDLKRRLPHYWSDYTDGVAGKRSIQKTVSTTFFLYFACILPSIAFGVLNDQTTNGIIDVKKVIIGQTIGGLLYAIFSGQPLNIILTTAPLCLFVKIVYALAEQFQVNFEAFYCCVGLWNSLFTILFALFDVSRIMKWSTRSTEEIFALFITIAFFVDAFKDAFKNFDVNYNTPECKLGSQDFRMMEQPNASVSYVLHNNSSMVNTAYNVGNWTREGLNASLAESVPQMNSTLESMGLCHRDSSLLFLLLMLGTLWLGISLYNFNKTPYLQASKREALADYALPVAVVTLSLIGSFFFQDVYMEPFRYNSDNHFFKLVWIDNMPWQAVLCSIGLGFSLSILMLMDQNISSAMVNNPSNKLKKGDAYHWDLFVVGVINIFLSIFTLPWMHAAIPHSPLHMRNLADVEERVDQGHVHQIIVRVRETRLTGIFSHILIGLSIFLLPYPLSYIPVAVLDGLFLYMAVTALDGNQLFERIILLFTEQAAYPPNHYIRRVPQRKVHLFTGFQALQLAVLCAIGFVPWPYVKMIFPVILFMLIPIRYKIIPRIIEQKYLNALDGLLS